MLKPANTELFPATIPEAACHTYKKVYKATDGRLKEARDHCVDLLRDYAQYADTHFLHEFPRNFHQRWFEMYLTVSLLRAGIGVCCPKPGPDIQMELNGRQLHIEAVCATSGEQNRPDSVPDLLPGRAADVPMDQYVLRVMSSLRYKANKIENYFQKGYISEQDLVVIAININAVNWLLAHMDEVMNRALYGVGDPVLSYVRDRPGSEKIYHPVVEKVIKEPPRDPVEVGCFVDGSMPRISSVWAFSGNAVKRPPELGGDCIQYPNLSSVNCWPQGTVSIGEEWRFEEFDEGWKGRKVTH